MSSWRTHVFRLNDVPLLLLFSPAHNPVTPDLSCHFRFMLSNLHFHRCLHVFISSDLLFNDLGSESFIMHSFSDKQTSHLLPPGWYLCHFFNISHFMLSMFIPASFLSQINPASSVFFFYCLCVLHLIHAHSVSSWMFCPYNQCMFLFRHRLY